MVCIVSWLGNDRALPVQHFDDHHAVFHRMAADRFVRTASWPKYQKLLFVPTPLFSQSLWHCPAADPLLGRHSPFPSMDSDLPAADRILVCPVHG